MKWDQQQPAKATAERRRGSEAPDIPPAGVSLPFSYTHRPGRSGAHGPAGSWVDFPIPQNSFVWVSLKMGSRARDRKRRASRRLGRSQTAEAIDTAMRLPLAALAALAAPFSYTHRPGRSGSHGPAGSGVDFPIPQNSFVWVSLKMGSRARDHERRPGPPHRPWPSASQLHEGCVRAPEPPTLDLPEPPTLDLPEPPTLDLPEPPTLDLPPHSLPASPTLDLCSSLDTLLTER
jgi:hypothetical protein